MLMKIIVLLVLAFIIYSLFSGLFYLVRDKGQSTRVVKALTWRVGLSVVLFLILMIAFHMGWLMPHVSG